MSHFAFRLAFHDCLPYEGQEGVNINGCDGCLDLDNRLNDHNVLQPTVAMLVTYLEFLNSVSSTVVHDFNGHGVNGMHRVYGKKCYDGAFYLVNNGKIHE